MKNEGKVFVIFILIILVYGLSYYAGNAGKFAFSPEYSNFALGIISLFLFFHKKITKYSFLLISLGFSFFYLLGDLKGFSLINPSNFILIKNLSLLLFSLMMLYDLYKRKYAKRKALLVILSSILIGYFVLRIVGLEMAFNPSFTVVKNCLGFITVVLLLRVEREKAVLPIMTRRVIMVIGMSFFVEIMTYLTA